ncbi:Heterogeneous nuclear ribonucleoprotein F [Echinococcus granulosus]|uniref:Heterogeneous nuclear ribonucleoprotein F n=1 Tax=Echinococcus granulosus TaxID=6210 RepID=W6UZ26_ECHGR|nr:Heterogeneous nuclear ribonucleoprotein F [Echinococcus granulosus]EUB58844.1 Heterogeneous nuclear ribonucleoprotein F [Echinococcus granulosus]
MAPILRIRGLPYSATADDVIDFFKGSIFFFSFLPYVDVTIKGGKRGISFPQGPNGRSNGEAFVELDNENDIERAMAHHKEHMGRRYIEGTLLLLLTTPLVFRSDEAEMKRAMGWQPDRNRKEFFARLRGLPYDTEKQDIFRFFNEERSGVGPMMRHGVRGDRGYYGNPPPPPGPPGPPYRGYGGDGGYGYGGGGPRGPPRPCPYSRPYGYDQRPPSPRGPYGPPSMDSGGGGGPYGSPRGGGVPPHVVHMRGLPFQATTDEIAAFFTPVQPVNITLRYNAQGRPTGEADAEFATHDEAKEAMKKDREKIGTRYIELFLDSFPSHGIPQSPGYIGGGGSSAGTSWNYGPPFYGGGSTAPPTPGGGANGAPVASVGRYNGGGRAPGGPPSRGYYDSPNDVGSGNAGYYGTGGGDYGYAPPPSGPVDDRYGGGDVRRGESGSGYGAPPPSSSVSSKVEGRCRIGLSDDVLV